MRMLLVIVAAISLIAFRPATATTLQESVVAGGLIVTDSAGNTLAPARLDGRWLLVLVGYTSCPDVCPFTLGNLAALYGHWEKDGAVREAPDVMFLAVDPKRDQKAELAEYVNHFHPAFLAATGKRAAIDRTVKSLGAFYRLNKPDPDGFYTVDHSAYVFLVDPDGKVRGKLAPPVRLPDLKEIVRRAKARG